MFNINQFRELIIVPTLDLLQMYSKDAEELLIFTCATESLGGYYLKQVKGPALGIYQMEPATYQDIWTNYIRPRNSLATLMALHFNCHRIPEPERMIWDLRFATAMARIFYRRFTEKLPAHDDVDAIWEYYKKYFNTRLGKAEKESSIKNYHSHLQIKSNP